jgi:hypothetical protein
MSVNEYRDREVDSTRYFLISTNISGVMSPLRVTTLQPVTTYASQRVSSLR